MLRDVSFSLEKAGEMHVAPHLGGTAKVSDAENGSFRDKTKNIGLRRKTRVTKGGGPVTTLDISFKDICVSVTEAGKKKLLLNNVSGYVGAGETLMILGSSGCGKSTLLRTLANVPNRSFHVQGEVLFDGRRLRNSDRKQVLSFVPQESPLLGEYTVSETMWFAARLYFGYLGASKEVIQNKIDDIIKAVGLETCKDVLVGNIFFRGLSGGQRKRLSIAVELISSPPCILLDEPTSGLDSSAASTLVQTLQNLAGLGHTIAATIHQPSSKLWSSFGKVMLMSQGRCVYFGTALEAVQYFGEMGLQCPEQFNPADYFSAVLSTDFANKNSNPKTPDELAEIFDASPVKWREVGSKLKVDDRETVVSVRGKHKSRFSFAASSSRFDVLDDTTTMFGGSMKHSGFWSSFITLLYRFLWSLLREPGLVLARVVVYILIGIILGLVFLNIGETYDTAAMLARPSVLLGAVGLYSFVCLSTIPFIMDNRAVLYRERRNGAYPVSAYVLADAIAIIPAVAVLAVCSSLIVVFMVKLNNFGMFYLTLFILFYTIECLVHAIACLLPKMEAAVAASVGIMGTLFASAGFLIPVNQMSWTIRWIAFVSPQRYSFRAFMRNEFDPIKNTTSPQFPNGDAMLEFFGLNDGPVKSLETDLLIIAGFSLVYLIVLYMTIRFFR